MNVKASDETRSDFNPVIREMLYRQKKSDKIMNTKSEVFNIIKSIDNVKVNRIYPIKILAFSNLQDSFNDIEDLIEELDPKIYIASLREGDNIIS